MIDKKWTIPQVLEHHPGARKVFDRHGLHGCGGSSGPQETLEFFAVVHGVPLATLLEELEAAKDDPAEEAPYEETLGDVLYRRFFRSSILVLWSAGAGLGIVALLLCWRHGSLASLDVFSIVQAHANAQVFGWVGLFVMGFALQGLPRFKGAALWRPDLADASLRVMLAGIVLRLAAAIPGPTAIPLGILGSLLEAAAAVLFVVVLSRTLAPSPQKDSWDRYILAGLACLVLAALVEPVLYVLFFLAPAEDALVGRVATFLGPDRDLQLLGFAGFFIFGVGQRILPPAFGFRAVSARISSRAFAGLVAGLGLDVVGWLLHRATGTMAWVWVSWTGILLWSLAALSLAVSLRGFTGGDKGRATKFLRAAHLWLLATCVLLLGQPAYLALHGGGFSHAWLGAARHAYAIGFLSLMILGVSSKVVPILQGLDPTTLPGLWAPFALVTGGTAIRVFGEIATDFAPGAAFPVMVLSGPVIALGFFLWGIHIWRILGSSDAAGSGGAGGSAGAGEGKGAGGSRAGEGNAGSTGDSRPDRIHADLTAARVVRWFPETLAVFERFGFRELKNPVLRNTIGRKVTLRTACSMKGVHLEAFLAALEQAAGASGTREEPPGPPASGAPDAQPDSLPGVRAKETGRRKKVGGPETHEPRPGEPKT